MADNMKAQLIGSYREDDKKYVSLKQKKLRMTGKVSLFDVIIKYKFNSILFLKVDEPGFVFGDDFVVTFVAMTLDELLLLGNHQR